MTYVCSSCGWTNKPCTHYTPPPDPLVAEIAALRAEVERLKGEYAWQTQNADNCRADASRMGQLWEQAVKDWKAAERSRDEAREALMEVLEGLLSGDEPDAVLRKAEIRAKRVLSGEKEGA